MPFLPPNQQRQSTESISPLMPLQSIKSIKYLIVCYKYCHSTVTFVYTFTPYHACTLKTRLFNSIAMVKNYKVNTQRSAKEPNRLHAYLDRVEQQRCHSPRRLKNVPLILMPITFPNAEQSSKFCHHNTLQ